MDARASIEASFFMLLAHHLQISTSMHEIIVSGNCQLNIYYMCFDINHVAVLKPCEKNPMTPMQCVRI